MSAHDIPFAELQSRFREPVIGGSGRRVGIGIPSIDFGPAFAAQNDVPVLETRWLHLVLALRDPAVRIALVTSSGVPRAELADRLALLPAGAEQRLEVIDLGDVTPRPLAEKLLRRPDVLDRLRRFAGSAAPERASIVPFAVGSSDREVAQSIGVPIDGVEPRFAHHGTKSGSRRLLAAAGVPIPIGEEDVRTPADLAAAIRRLRRRLPELPAAIVKLDAGTTGDGNLVLALRSLPAPGAVGEIAALDRLVDAIPIAYLERLASGAVVEEMVTGLGFASPSAQARILPGGAVELLATHDQVLGGEHGQAYTACKLPAASAYGWQVAALAERVGHRLAEEGVIGRFAVDFVVTRMVPGDGWRVRAVEVNMREGATTHPYATLRLLADARLDGRHERLVAPDGAIFHVFATDTLASPSYLGIDPEELLAAAELAGVAYSGERRSGVIFHMLDGLRRDGRIGLIAIGSSPAECLALRHRARSLLERLAADAVGAVG